MGGARHVHCPVWYLARGVPTCLLGHSLQGRDHTGVGGRGCEECVVGRLSLRRERSGERAVGRGCYIATAVRPV